jgi:hypothetical protein
VNSLLYIYLVSSGPNCWCSAPAQYLSYPKSAKIRSVDDATIGSGVGLVTLVGNHEIVLQIRSEHFPHTHTL